MLPSPSTREPSRSHPDSATAAHVSSDAVAAVLSDLADVIGARALDTGDDTTQVIVDAALDAVLERVENLLAARPVTEVGR